jgi:hypothetical protein
MSFDKRFRDQLARRLLFAEEVSNYRSVDWAGLRNGLTACDSWPAILNWLTHLVEALRGLDIPFFEYAEEVIKRASPIAELTISKADLVEEVDYGLVVRRLRSDMTDHALKAWTHEALLSWAPWKPHVDPELFNIQFEGDWPEGEFTGLPSPGDPVKDVDRLIPDSPGYALVVHYYTGEASSIVEFGQLRSSWTKMHEWFWGDFVIMPIAPNDADWIICYFHHNYLELGRRVGDWPHKVSADI